MSANIESPGSVELNADTFYRLLPDFTRYNNRFDLAKACKIAIVPLLGLIVDTNPNSLLHRVSLYSALGILTAKTTLSLCAYIHNKIWENTNDRWVWGLLLPPTNPAITDAQDRCYNSEKAFSHSFPDGTFVLKFGTAPNVVIPKPKPYTLEQLESECEEWMQDSLAIAQAVREDLKKWSDEHRFPKKDGALLSMQPRGSQELHGASWLYKGFFRLPAAYRTIFNLTDPVAEISKMSETLQNSSIAQDFLKTYPEQNRELLNGWKEKFFTPGTKQYQWREQFNAEMGKIADQLGGLTIENVLDKRFVNWGQPHGENKHEFAKTPDTRPT